MSIARGGLAPREGAEQRHPEGVKGIFGVLECEIGYTRTCSVLSLIISVIQHNILTPMVELYNSLRLCLEALHRES